MLTTGPVSEVLPVEVDNNDSGRSSFSGKISVTGILLRPSELRRLSFEVRPSGIGVESALSRLAFRSLRCLSLAPRRPSSSQQTEAIPDALDPDDERAVRPVSTEKPEAEEGGRNEELLETTEDGRPAALRVRQADSAAASILSCEDHIDTGDRQVTFEGTRIASARL